MGKLLSKIFGNKEMRILMLGLDAAGKTSEHMKTPLNSILRPRYFCDELETYLSWEPNFPYDFAVTYSDRHI